MTAKGGWIYMMTNKPNGILYIGVTADLLRRVSEHRAGSIPGFTQQFGLKRLVYFERHEEIIAAIERESQMKKWRRSWKVQLLMKENFAWDDLYEQIL